MSTGCIQFYIKGFLIGGNWKVVEYPSWLWAYITQLCHLRNNYKAQKDLDLVNEKNDTQCYVQMQP